MYRFETCLAAIIVALIAGCNETSAPASTSDKPLKPPVMTAAPGGAAPTSPAPDAPTTSGSAKPIANDSVSLTVATPAEVDAAIAGRKGKIVVVDIWATWCIPCKKEFPHLVELHKAYAKDGVVCMSVAMDVEKQHENALSFLKEKQATFSNFRMERDEKATSDWQEHYLIGPIPVVLVFGRDGKLAKKFEGDSQHDFSYNDVNKLVNELLKK